MNSLQISAMRAALILAAVLLPTIVAAQDMIRGTVERVIDGDGLVVAGTEIRLCDIKDRVRKWL